MFLEFSGHMTAIQMSGEFRQTDFSASQMILERDRAFAPINQTKIEMKMTVVIGAAMLLANCASIPGMGMDGDRDRDGSVSRGEVNSAKTKYEAGRLNRQDETERLNHARDMVAGLRQLVGGVTMR